MRAGELVELSERVYREVFRVGLWVATATAVYALALVGVQVGQIDRLLAAGVCIAIAAGLVMAASLHGPVYELLRRRPVWALAVAAVLAAAHLMIGPGSQVLFPATLVVIGLLGAPMSMRWVFAAALLVAAAQASPVLTHDLADHDQRSLIAAGAADLFVPLLFSALIERLARFMLDLHRAITTAASERPAARGARRWARRPARRPLALEPGVAISTGQVTRHLAHARRRVGVDTTEQLVAWAIDNGLIPPAQPE